MTTKTRRILLLVLCLFFACIGYVYYEQLRQAAFVLVFGAVVLGAILYYAFFICGAIAAILWFAIGMKNFIISSQIIHFHKFRHRQFSSEDKIREDLAVTGEIQVAQKSLQQSTGEYHNKSKTRKQIEKLLVMDKIRAFSR